MNRPIQNLAGFLAAVYGRLMERLSDPSFDPRQRTLLKRTTQRWEALTAGNPMGDPLAIIYLIARAWRVEKPLALEGTKATAPLKPTEDVNGPCDGKSRATTQLLAGRNGTLAIDEQGEQLALFCLLYILALDLFDDVQDDDLAGKPHEAAGAAVALNNAMTLFCLGLEALQKAIALAPEGDRRLEYLRTFNRVSLLAGAGQYRDLLGATGARTPEEVLAMQAAKTSSIALVAECAAIYAGCDEADVALYREAGSLMAQLIQVVDDVRDIFGKCWSPDLATGKMTYPLACFLRDASAEQKAEYEVLVQEKRVSLGAVRQLLYKSGAIATSARTVENLRQSIHRALAATGNGSAPQRTLLHIVDSLAGALYVLPDIEESRFIRHPNGPWHRHVRETAKVICNNLAALQLPALPPLRPWHQLQWMYDPQQKVIYYSDIQEQMEEILPAAAALLGVEDPAEAERLSWEQAPAVLAHEVFHFWRHALGRLTKDYWYEEWAANALAAAYLKEFHPELAVATLEISERMLACRLSMLSETGQRIIEREYSAIESPGGNGCGYQVDILEVAVIQAEMVRRLHRQELTSLDALVSQLLHSDCECNLK